jgi:hypothetical protein
MRLSTCYMLHFFYIFLTLIRFFRNLALLGKNQEFTHFTTKYLDKKLRKEMIQVLKLARMRVVTREHCRRQRTHVTGVPTWPVVLVNTLLRICDIVYLLLANASP